MNGSAVEARRTGRLKADRASFNKYGKPSPSGDELLALPWRPQVQWAVQWSALDDDACRPRSTVERRAKSRRFTMIRAVW